VTHLPYVVGSYGLAVALVLVFGVSATTRLARARRKLAAIDPRGER